MNIVARKSKLRTVKPGDPLFTLNDGFVIAQRAGVEISEQCPREYRLIISTCLANGWLTPVACMTAEE